MADAEKLLAELESALGQLRAKNNSQRVLDDITLFKTQDRERRRLLECIAQCRQNGIYNKGMVVVLGKELLQACNRIELKTCLACSNPYEYTRKGCGNYPGKSPHRCVDCELQRFRPGISTFGSRRPGHNTRQQHKKVHPDQK